MSCQGQGELQRPWPPDSHSNTISRLMWTQGPVSSPNPQPQPLPAPRAKPLHTQLPTRSVFVLHSWMVRTPRGSHRAGQHLPVSAPQSPQQGQPVCAGEGGEGNGRGVKAEALSHSTSSLVFSWASWRTCYPVPQSLLPAELEPTNPALSSHWSFPSHPTLPLFINPPFSAPSLTSQG